VPSKRRKRRLPISGNDRDTAVEHLKDAFARGDISREEMDERLEVVLTAKTYGELASALAGVSLAALNEEDVGPTVAIEAIGGKIKRDRGWRVPRVLKIDSRFGKVDLDLSRALIEHRVVDIELRLEFGGARLVLPRSATVDYEGLRAGWSQPTYKAPRHDPAGGPHIRISGAMEYGRLRIRHRWR
jgi:Domain of unknown function (DUF1707)